MKILIDAHLTFGDLIQSIYIAKAIKIRKKDAYICVIIGSNSDVEILKLTNCIDDYCIVNLKNRLSIGNLITFFKLRIKNFDIGLSHVAINPSLSALMLKLCGCKKTIGLYKKDVKFHFDHAVKFDKNTHLIDRNLKLAECVTGVEEKRNGLFIFDNKLLKSLKRKDEKIIGLCIGCGNFKYNGIEYNCKRISIEFYTKLADMLSNAGYKICLFGGKSEVELLKNFNKKKNINNYVGKLSVGKSIQTLLDCKIVVGVDTGLMHAADALRIRTIWLMGPMNPSYCGPLFNGISIKPNVSCSPCDEEKRFKCSHRRCLTEYSPESIFKLIDNISKKEIKK